MTDVEITMTARVRVNAEVWATEWGIDKQSVAEDTADYVRHHVDSSLDLITLEWE